MDELPQSSLEEVKDVGESVVTTVWRRRFTVGLAMLCLAVFAWRMLPSRNPDDLFRTAWTALQVREIDTARVVVSSWPSHSRNDPRLRLLEGVIALREARLENALHVFSGLDPASPIREPLLQVTGECLSRLGRFREAHQCLTMLTAEFPENVEGHRFLAATYFELGANDHAIQELGHVMRLAPEDFRPHQLAAEMYGDFEKFDESVRQCREALKRSPTPTAEQSIRERLAESLNALQMYEAALEAVRGRPPTIRSMIAEAESLLSLGRIDLAREKVDAALTLEPQLTPALGIAARLALDDGQNDKAVEILIRLLSRSPHEYQSRYRLALAYQRAGRKDDYAREMIRFEESRGLYRLLSELSSKAIEEPDNATVRRQLAETCRTLGKAQLAVIWERAAANVAPKNSKRPRLQNSEDIPTKNGN